MEKQLIAHYYYIVYLVIIATAGAFISICFNKQSSLRSAMATLFGSIVFGALTGYIVGLFTVDKWAKVAAAGCGLCAKEIYEKVRKKIPSWFIKKSDL
jgi:hypothetical protein